MPQNRFEWHERIKAVEREYWAVRIAVDELWSAAAHDPTVLGAGPNLRDLASAKSHLEGTYLVRMFAEFETAIRSYWRPFKPKARARDLLGAAADGVGRLSSRAERRLTRADDARVAFSSARPSAKERIRGTH